MAKSFSELQTLAIQIRDELNKKKNSAQRVGSALLDIIDNCIQNITDIKQKLSVFEHACSGFKRVSSEAQLPVTPSQEDLAKGFLVNTSLYLYVGTGGNAVNGRYFNVGDIRGPQGEPGSKGETGNTGPTGEKGEQGNSGVTGDTSDIVVINNLDGGESEEGSIKVLAAEQGKVLNKKYTELEAHTGIVIVKFTNEYQTVKLPFTIKEGETIYLSSNEGITELNGRTGSDTGSESPQNITNGTVAEKDINYVRCLATLGSVCIYTNESLNGKVYQNTKDISRNIEEVSKNTEEISSLKDRTNSVSNYTNNIQTIEFVVEYQNVKLPVTIKKGKTIYLSSDDDITEINCRTTGDTSGESAQIVGNGTVAEKDINYVRNLSKLGKVYIYTDESLNGRITEISNYINNRQTVEFTKEYQNLRLLFAIKKGETIYLSSDDGITEINGRTTGNTSGESAQIISNGTVAEKDINYVRNLSKLGKVDIFTNKSIDGKISNIDSRITSLEDNKEDINIKNDFNLPSKIYVLKDVQSNFWHQSLVKIWNPYSYYLEFKGTTDYQRRTPLVCSILTSSTEKKSMEVVLWDNNSFKEVAKKSTEVLVGEPNSSVKTNEVKVMFVGSSTVQLTYFDYAIKKYVNNYKLIGLRHKAGDNDCKHEGRGGASLNSYMSVSISSNRHYYPFWQPNGENRYWGATYFWENAHLYPDSESGDGYYCGLYVQDALDKFDGVTGMLKNPTNGDIMYFSDESSFKRYNGASWEVVESNSYTWGFDFAKYLAMWELETPDIICITLGSNDFRYATLPIDFETWCGNMQKLIDSVHSVREDIQFVICNQGPFGNYGFNGENSYLMNYKMWLHLQSIIANFDNRQDENIHVLAQGAEISSEYGFDLIKLNESYIKPTDIYTGEERMKVQAGDIVHPTLSLNNMGTPIASFIQYIRK